MFTRARSLPALAKTDESNPKTQSLFCLRMWSLMAVAVIALTRFFAVFVLWFRSSILGNRSAISMAINSLFLGDFVSAGDEKKNETFPILYPPILDPYAYKRHIELKMKHQLANSGNRCECAFTIFVQQGNGECGANSKVFIFLLIFEMAHIPSSMEQRKE